jgi:ABC-type antimicrobial peptide transport system permease subunit
MALGATSGEVAGLFVKQALRMTGIGLAVGLVGAAAVSQALQRLLFGVTGTDPVTYAAVAFVFLAVASAASLIPAVRAGRTEPVVALRNE